MRLGASIVFALAGWLIVSSAQVVALEFPGPPPGEAQAKWDGSRLVMQNGAISATWAISEGRTGCFRLVELTDRISGAAIRPADESPFSLMLAGGHCVECVKRTTASPQANTLLRPQAKPTLERIAAIPNAVRLADRWPGWKASLTLTAGGLPGGDLSVIWQAVLRDQSNYVRQELAVRAEGRDVPLESLTLVDLPAKGAKAEGVVDGYPVVAGSFFFACEHPMSSSRVEGGRATCSIKSPGPIKAGQSLRRGCVLGVAPAGQIRRSFAYYVERERPRPYQPFLHYNSWYDIAWGDRKMNEGQCLEVIGAYGRELVEKRGVRVDSFVFDDGWDDNRTLWRFHSGFPRGFTPLEAAARKFHSSVGVWLSPWGGYGQAQKERLEYGKTQGFEANRNGFSLAGPKYYGRFRDACAEMVRKYGVNYFKFDGIAQGLSSTGPGPQFAGDVEGLLRLILDLRRLRPDLYISVTTGTWPSPFWLFYGDSVWRNGGDMGFFGPGSKRQQWITYRDMIEHQWIVRRAPLYPINSLMTQGIAQARLGDASKLGADLREWKSEVQSFFASGTQLQELYVTPQMLTPEMWDVLAEGAAWSRKNADLLVDVHWIGGDPGKGQAYGFAAWQPRQGMLALRNPADKPGTIEVDVAQAFELPPGAPATYRLASPWKDASASAPAVLRGGQPYPFQLAPFEVLVFDAIPQK